MAEPLKVGDKIPPFLVKDHEGMQVKDEDVLGTPLVLYFYPSNASAEAADIAAAISEKSAKFDVMQTLIAGVSTDKADSLKKFIEEKKLTYSLLSDEKKDMCAIFNVLDDKLEVIPSVFVFDEKGILQWMEKPLNVRGLSDRIIEALEEHCKVDVARYDDFVQDYKDFLDANLPVNEDAEKIEEEILKEFGLEKRDLELKKKEEE